MTFSKNFFRIQCDEYFNKKKDDQQVDLTEKLNIENVLYTMYIIHKYIFCKRWNLKEDHKMNNWTLKRTWNSFPVKFKSKIQFKKSSFEYETDLRT